MKPIIGITADIQGSSWKLNRQYADAVEASGACPIVLLPVKDIKNLVLRIDGLLIPGGGDLHPMYYNEKINYGIKVVEKVRSGFEIAVIHEIMKLRKPVLGICYGMQLINVVFGGSLYQDIGMQAPMTIDHRSGCHKIRVAGNKFFSRGRYKVNSSHHQAIKIIGNGLEAIAFSDDNLIEAVSLSDYPFLLGVQWHPERMKNKLSARIFRSFVEAAGGRK